MTAEAPAPSTGGRAPRIAPAVAQQAVQWWMELRTPDVDEVRREAWRRWRAAAPEHEAAWQRIEAVGREMAGIPLPLARAALVGAAPAQRRRAVQVLAAVVVAGGGAALLLRAPGAYRPWLADAATAVGEQRTLRLQDGSTVVLDTGSAANIRLGEESRVVELVRGKILVQTAQDRLGRPFLVQTGAGRVRALGTRFTVQALADAVDVGVLQGAVELTPADAPGAARVLRAGEQGGFTRAQAQAPAPLAEGAGAWADGMLVVSRMRLDDFLAELGRYRQGRLGCDPAIAHLRVSGAYPLADTDRILAALTSALDVEVHVFTRYWVTVKPRAGTSKNI